MDDFLRVLLIDDNPHDRALVERELRREFPDLEKEHVIDAEGLGRALEAGGFDLVVTDYQLRWTDGLTVLRTVKSRWPDCPVIMFTGTGSEEVAVEAMKAGLDDYVLKSPKHLVRLSAAVRSVLERAEARRRAARLEVRLEALLNRLNVGVFRSTLDGRVLEANPAFWRLLGLTPSQEARAVSLNAFYSKPEDRPLLMGLLKKTGGLLEHEIQLRRADGSPIWVSLTETLNAVPGGEIFIDGLMEDVTERRQAREALRESEERFKQLAENVREVFWMSDATQTRMIYISPAYEEVWARTCQSLYEQPLSFLDAVHPEDRQRVIAAVERQVRGERTEEEYRIIHPDGSIRWVYDRGFPIRDETGQVCRIAGIAEDITERRRMEDALWQTGEYLRERAER
jgi:PAS domain S-box-containing protein